MEYYSAIKRNECVPVVVRWMNLEALLQSEVSQKEKNKYRILTHIYEIQKSGTDEPSREWNFRPRGGVWDKLIKQF